MQKGILRGVLFLFCVQESECRVVALGVGNGECIDHVAAVPRRGESEGDRSSLNQHVVYFGGRGVSESDSVRRVSGREREVFSVRSCRLYGIADRGFCVS